VAQGGSGLKFKPQYQKKKKKRKEKEKEKKVVLEQLIFTYPLKNLRGHHEQRLRGQWREAHSGGTSQRKGTWSQMEKDP
jgi:mRNA-degrading endonuclease YafQ of YafQ-DinJ toxin-antitoxin module